MRGKLPPSLSLSPHRHAGQCRLLVSRHSLSLWSPTAFSHVVDPHPNRRAHVLSRGGTEKSPPNHVSPSREAVIIGSSSFRPVRFVRFVVNPGLRLWKQEKIRVRDVSCPQKKGKSNKQRDGSGTEHLEWAGFHLTLILVSSYLLGPSPIFRAQNRVPT